MRSIAGLALGALLLAGCAGGGGEQPQDSGLVCESGCSGGGGIAVSLGSISLGHRVEKGLRLRNAGEAIPVGAMYLEAGPGLTASLFCETGCAGGRLEPGALLIARLAWAPAEAGLLAARPLLHLGDRSFELQVEGSAHEVELACDAAALDFGLVPEGGSETRWISCENRGEAALDLAVEGLPPGFGVDMQSRRLEPGEGAAFQFRFSGGTASSGLVELQLPDGSAAHTVRLSAAPGEPLEVSGGAAGCLQFGLVAPGASRTEPLVLRNRGTGVLAIDGFALRGDAAFAVVDAGSFALAPGESREVEVAFAPVGTGPQQATLSISTGGRSVPVCLEGEAGGPLLRCDVAPIDFGATRIGSPRVRSIHCSNEGWNDPASDADELLVESVEVAGSGFRATLPEGPGPWPVGASFDVEVTHDPAQEGSTTGTVTVRTQDGAVAVVELAGEGRSLPACSYEIEPSLEFGEVAGRDVSLPLTLRNTGSAQCLVADWRLTGDAAFGLGAEPATSLAPGESLAIPVRFSPSREGDAAGELAFSISADAPGVRIPIHGRSTGTCLRRRTVDPSIGTTDLGCSVARREILLVNECDEPVVLTGAALRNGAPFRITRNPAFPTTIEPGFTASLEVAYEATEARSDLDGLFVSVQGWELPLLVQVAGSAAEDALVTERFESTPKVDVLFVMDNSGGGNWHGLGAYPHAFFDHGPSADYQIGVTTTGADSYGEGDPNAPCPGGALGNEHGRLFPVNGSSPRILDDGMSTPTRDSAWFDNFAVGECHSAEKGLDAARFALSPPVINHADVAATALPMDGNLGFLREEAELHVVFLSDEEDQSALPVERYVEFLRGLKDDHRRVKAHSVTPDPLTGCQVAIDPGDRYFAVVTAMGGTFISWCTADGVAILDRLGAEILAPRGCFALADVPAPGATGVEEALDVRVNGVRMRATGINGNRNWLWDGEAGTVCFAAPLAADSEVSVTYRRACDP